MRTGYWVLEISIYWFCFRVQSKSSSSSGKEEMGTIMKTIVGNGSDCMRAQIKLDSVEIGIGMCWFSFFITGKLRKWNLMQL